MTTLNDIASSEYSDYFKMYLDLVDQNQGILDTLTVSKNNTIQFLETLDRPLDYSYAPGKWNIAQVIMHNIDTERVFQYRALRFMRGDGTELAGFDQDIFVDSLKEHAFAKADLLKSFKATRNATIALFDGAKKDELKLSGIASGKSMSARVIPFLIAGHNLHHEDIIRERY